MFKGKHWQLCTILTATLFPGLLFLLFFFPNLFVWGAGSDAAVAFGSMLLAFFLWKAISASPNPPAISDPKMASTTSPESTSGDINARVQVPPTRPESSLLPSSTPLHSVEDLQPPTTEATSAQTSEALSQWMMDELAAFRERMEAMCPQETDPTAQLMRERAAFRQRRIARQAREMEAYKQSENERAAVFDQRMDARRAQLQEAHAQSSAAFRLNMQALSVLPEWEVYALDMDERATYRQRMDARRAQLREAHAQCSAAFDSNMQALSEQREEARAQCMDEWAEFCQRRPALRLLELKAFDQCISEQATAINQRMQAHAQSTGGRAAVFGPSVDPDLAQSLQRHTQFLHELLNPPRPAPESRTSQAVRDQFVLFFDGGSRGNPGPGGAGAVVVRVPGDGTPGELIWTASMSYQAPTTTTNQAKYAGLLTGLKAAKANEWRPLDVVGDSKLILTQMRRDCAPLKRTIRGTYAKARRIADELGVTHWIHHPRAYNCMADAAANIAMDSKASAQVHHPATRRDHDSIADHLASDLGHWSDSRRIG